LREGGEVKPKTVQQPKAKEKKAEPKPEVSKNAINATQVNMLRKKLEKQGKAEAGFCEHFGITNIEGLPSGKINDALAWAERE